MYIKFFLVDESGEERNLFTNFRQNITIQDMVKANEFSRDILDGITSNIKLCEKEFGKKIFTKEIRRKLKKLEKEYKDAVWFSVICSNMDINDTVLKNGLFLLGKFPILSYITKIYHITKCTTLLKMNLYDVSDFVFDVPFNINRIAFRDYEWEKIITRVYPDVFEIK